MSSYARNYLKELIHDLRMHEGNAYAAFFALTCKDAYTHIIQKTGNEYRTEQIMEAAYAAFFENDNIPATPKLLVNKFNLICELKLMNEVKDQPKGKETASTFRLHQMELLYSLLVSNAHLPKNTISIETLYKYGKVRNRLYANRLLFAAAIAAFAVISAINFIPPSISLSLDGTGKNFLCHVEINTLSSITAVTAEIGGTPMRVTMEADGTYTIHPSANGTMNISVRNLLGKVTTASAEIHDVDTEPPVLVSAVAENNVLTVTATDNRHVNWKNTYVILKDGSREYAENINTHDSSADFPNYDQIVSVSINDDTGNTLKVNIQ